MKKLILVRHGESLWNASRRLQGQADIGLSERGQDQARALAPLIARLNPALIWTSDLQRATRTAALLGYPDARPEPLLREHSVGDWTGLHIDDLDPSQYQRWRAGTFIPENGEPWGTFRERACGVVESVRATQAATVLLVCHGGVIRALLDGLVGLPPDRILPVGPASLTILDLQRAEARLEAMNVTAFGATLNAPD